MAAVYPYIKGKGRVIILITSYLYMF